MTYQNRAKPLEASGEAASTYIKASSACLLRSYPKSLGTWTKSKFSFKKLAFVVLIVSQRRMVYYSRN